MLGAGRKNGGDARIQAGASGTGELPRLLYISFLTSHVICFCNVDFFDLDKFTTGQGSAIWKLYGVKFWTG